MLAIEASEIGCTLLALPVPGLKPLFGKWFSLFDSTAHQSGSPDILRDTRSRGISDSLWLHGRGEEISKTEITSRGSGPSDSDEDLIVGYRINVRRPLTIETSEMVKDLQKGTRNLDGWRSGK